MGTSLVPITGRRTGILTWQFYCFVTFLKSSSSIKQDSMSTCLELQLEPRRWCRSTRHGWKMQAQKPPAPRPLASLPQGTAAAVAWLSLQEGFSAATQGVFASPRVLPGSLLISSWGCGFGPEQLFQQRWPPGLLAGLSSAGSVLCVCPRLSRGRPPPPPLLQCPGCSGRASDGGVMLSGDGVL